MASRSVAKDHDPHLDAQIAAGELFIKKLKSETSKCEVSTWSAIFEAQEPPEKRRALDAGIDEWAKALCAAAVKYYDTCFELGRRSGPDLDGKQPAEFAYGWTAKVLSMFLRLNALDGAEENSDGRVRQFIRDVCGPPDVDVDNLPALSLDPAPSQAFRLPTWAAKYTFGDRIAGKSKRPTTGTLSTEQTESVILGKQARLTARLLESLLDTYRDALITLGMSPSPSSKQEAPIVVTQAKPLKPLPKQKHVDYSRYMDAAGLTERQYKCYSLHMEYRLSKAEISRRLEIARPGVDKHIALAGQKIEECRANQDACRKAAAKRPQE